MTFNSCSTRQRWVVALATLIAGAAVALLLLTRADTAVGARAGQELVFIYLSHGGDQFLNYDGASNYDPNGRDWPVTLIFYNNAEVDKVKNAIGQLYPNLGNSAHEGYAVQPNTHIHRFDSDRGRKTDCQSYNNDYHYRVYANSRTDRFYSPRWGYYVVGTSHIDHAEDQCGGTGLRYGRSEFVEHRVAEAVNAVANWPVRFDYIGLHNREPYRVDRRDRRHLWQNDGYATGVRVP